MNLRIKFRLRPILSEMKDLYLMPRSDERFNAYLSKLQGQTQSDLALPLSGFNPMAKDHIIDKISELQDLGAERVMQSTIEEYNSTLDSTAESEIKVVLNLADDSLGGWTNHYSTDYESKFKLNGFVKRNFCVPYFWTSERYTEEIIRNRTLEYLCRTTYRISHPQPKTLKEHLDQEVFVASSVSNQNKTLNFDHYKHTEKFYLEFKDSDQYDIVFNFFYGDQGSATLGYKQYGNSLPLGFEYAAFLSHHY